MATNPWGVLVVPAEGDPGGLLAFRRLAIPSQPTGRTLVASTEAARAPKVLGWDSGRDASSPLWPSALPLWWDGALVPEGWDRARRCLRRLDYVQRISSGIGNMTWQTLDTIDPICGQAITIAGWTVATGLASRVVLLDLVDGRLVERTDAR